MTPNPHDTQTRPRSLRRIKYHPTPSLPPPTPRTILRNRQRSPALLRYENLKSNHPYGHDLDELLSMDDEGKDLMAEGLDRWKSQAIRIYFQNVNGIRLGDDGVDIGDLFCHMSEIRADAFAFAETKLNTLHRSTKELFYRYKQSTWDHCKIQFGESEIPIHGPDKPGGLLLGVTDCLVGRVRSQFSDPYGRWCSISLLGRDNREVHLIVAYQAVQESGDHGDTTYYEQQRSLLRQAGYRDPNPRAIFIQDLSAYVERLRQQGHDIILMGDFNEETGENTQGLQRILDAGHLSDCHLYLHGLQGETPTYSRGVKRVDYIFASERLLPHLKAGGIEPFNHRIFSDHRGLFVDLRLPGIFDRAPVPIANPSQRHVRTDVPPILIKYVFALDEYCQLHRVYERAKRLLNDDDVDPELAETVEKDLLRGMLQAELKCRNYQRLPWTLEVHTAMTKLHILKRHLSQMRTGWDMSSQIHRRQAKLQKPIELPETYEDTVKAIRRVRQECRQAARQAKDKKDAYHQLRIEALKKEFPDKDPAKLEAQYLKAQEMKNMYQRIPSVKTRQSSGITVLKVPRDPSADPKTVPRDDPSLWRLVQDPSDIEDTLLRRNYAHFGQAHGTPLADPSVADALSWSATSDTAESILDGEFDVTLLTSDIHAQRILRACQRRVPERQHRLTREEMIKKFKLWDERTTTSPSGRHLSHYHALFRPSGLDPTTDPIQFERFMNARRELWDAHFATLSFAEKRGYCFDLWKRVVTAMIEKEPGQPYLHRLRVIHLYEATLNAFFGIKFRDLLHYAEEHDLLNAGCYGSRPGRQALDPVFIEILQYDYVFATRWPHLKFNNDATSCYDRMLAYITTLIARSFGLQATVAQVQGDFLEFAKYFIKTTLGVSESSYSHSGDNPVFGNGQGSTSSPPAWGFTSSVLFDVYDQYCHGAHYSTVDSGKQLKLGMVGFVDDNNNSASGTRDTTLDELIGNATHDAQLWRDLLYASGGDLELSKCYYHLLWINFSSKGAPVLRPGTFGPPLEVHDSSGVRTQIKQLSFGTAHKILGSFQAPVSSQKSQYLDLLSKAKKYARTLASSFVRYSEAWTFYYNFFIPSISYPLAVAHLSESQLDDLQRSMVSVTLQKMNYVSTFPRAVVFGPSRFGGMFFPDLRVEQGVLQVKILLRNLRIFASQAGDLAIITLENLQYTAGVGRPLLQDTSYDIPYLDGLWIKSLRSFLSRIDGSITIANFRVQPLQRERDVYLMDFALEIQFFTDAELCVINACRLYLEVLTLSDIATVDGKFIQPEVYRGIPGIDHCRSRLLEPRQDRPADPHWAKWRKLLRILADSQGKLHLPLGRWLHSNGSLRRAWPVLYSPANQSLVTFADGKYHHHTVVRPSVFQLEPSFSSESCPDGIPVPHSAIRDGLQIPATFLGLTPSSVVAEASTFQEYIDQQEHHISSLLQHWEIVDGEIYSFVSSITDLSDIMLVTDGGATDEYGGYGWVIARISSKARLARGKGLTFGHDPKSYRAENYGTKAANLFLQLGFKFVGKPLPSGSLQFRCDNQGLIKKQLYVRSYRLALQRVVLDSEWDLVVANHHLFQAYPDPPSIQHVKGHQDTKGVRVSSLPLEVQLNIEADQLSTEAMESFGTPFLEVPFDPLTRAQLTIAGRTVTRRIETTLRTAASLPPLVQYYRERLGWPEGFLDYVDWDSFSQASKRHQQKRKFLTKLSFCQLPTGGRLHKRDTKYDHRCPSCLAENETDDHLFQCPHNTRSQWRKDLILFVVHKFDSILDPDLLRLLRSGMQLYFHPSGDGISYDDYPPSFRRTIRYQNILGWDQIFRGKFAYTWRELQHDYWRRIGHSPTSSEASWLTTLISILFEKSHELWLRRNEDRHGHDRATSYQAEKAQVERELRRLYNLKDKVQVEDRDRFYDTVDDHLRLPLRSIQNWIHINRPLIKYSINEARLEAIRHTPSIAMIFPKVPTPPAFRKSRTARRNSIRTRIPNPLKSTRPTHITSYLRALPPFGPHRPTPVYRSRKQPTSSQPFSRMSQRKLSEFWPDHPG